MSLKVLKLEQLHLVNSGDNLKLSVSSSVHVRVPTDISHLGSGALVEALTSGKIWVSRGISCALAIGVCIDGKPLNENTHLRVLEYLGLYMRDLQLWSQLSLSTSLDMLQTKEVECLPDILIYWNHDLPAPEPEKQPKLAWQIDNNDTRAPESVLCADFERLHIHFDYQTVKPEPQGTQLLENEVDVGDIMLLDVAPEISSEIPTMKFQNTHLKEFEATIRNMQSLSNSMTTPTKILSNTHLKGFETTVSNMRSLSGSIKISFDTRASPNRPATPRVQISPEEGLYTSAGPSNHNKVIAQSATNVSMPTRKRNRQRYSIKVTSILVTWFEANLAWPFPTRDQSKALKLETGLSSKQLSNWLIHRRKNQPVLLAAWKDRKSKEKVGKDLKNANEILSYDGQFDEHDILLSEDENLLESEPRNDYTISKPNIEQYADDEMLFSSANLEKMPAVKFSQSPKFTLSPKTRESKFPGQIPSSSNNEMLFWSRDSDDTPSLTFSQSSADSLRSSLHNQLKPLDTSPQFELFSPFEDLTPVIKLADAALHILIAGYSTRARPSILPPDISIESPPPKLSVANLVPSLFSPGFKQEVAQNARFLPTISHAIGISMARNVQCPTLKEKLVQISGLSTSPILAGTNEGSEKGEKGTTERLSAVIQARLWSMMQRNIFDPSATRKLCRDRGTTMPSQEQEQFLGHLEPKSLIQGGEDEEDDDHLGQGEADDSEFEDLLTCEDRKEDLLDYFESDEWERRRVEEETDEMLFGNGDGWDDEEGVKRNEVYATFEALDKFSEFGNGEGILWETEAYWPQEAGNTIVNSLGEECLLSVEEDEDLLGGGDGNVYGDED